MRHDIRDTGIRDTVITLFLVPVMKINSNSFGCKGQLYIRDMDIKDDRI